MNCLAYSVEYNTAPTVKVPSIDMCHLRHKNFDEKPTFSVRDSSIRGIEFLYYIEEG